MNDDYTQSINNLWTVVLKEAASIMPRDSASMRAFFFAQIIEVLQEVLAGEEQQYERDDVVPRQGPAAKQTRDQRGDAAIPGGGTNEKGRHPLGTLVASDGGSHCVLSRVVLVVVAVAPCGSMLTVLVASLAWAVCISCR